MRTLILTAGGLLAMAFTTVVHADPTTPAARTIVLVRHGHYAADPKADPKLGPGLTPLGIAQAHLVGARLAGLPYPFDSVLVSPLTRAQQSARVIAEDLPGAKLQTVAGLEECTPPTRHKEITASMRPEDLAACAKQLDQLYTERFVPAQGQEAHELLVCHGNVTRYLITKALGVDTEAWLEMSVGHASITTIRIEADGSARLISAGDVGHLPPNMHTGASGDPERTLSAP